MREGPEWFAPKRYGFGAGLPIAWQGWLILSLFLVVVLGSALLFRDRPQLALAIVLPAAAALVIVAARTTRGGWRWRWGAEE
ncbi:hypothetical protein [Sphingomonas xanthus]|uniref:Uncharacterized protein n=1 Tax=Sphingomonas xanthus TaxID=2594473 RepID=A0A516IRW9_9SPHN|nr:hypothetical protein [Sphingomonas xanthus]QDP19631.1 hypothetical protein FMM02_06435 [Sphingomonas xanthus]